MSANVEHDNIAEALDRVAGDGPAWIRDVEERIRDLERASSGVGGSAMRDVERD